MYCYNKHSFEPKSMNTPIDVRETISKDNSLELIHKTHENQHFMMSVCKRRLETTITDHNLSSTFSCNTDNKFEYVNFQVFARKFIVMCRRGA